MEVKAHLESSLDVPSNLKCLFGESSKNLNESQKQFCEKFLNKFRDVFSKEIIAGNCEMGEHIINLQDSSSIKQVPRRIPIHFREEVNKIKDMRDQGVRNLKVHECRQPY